MSWIMGPGELFFSSLDSISTETSSNSPQLQPSASTSLVQNRCLLIGGPKVGKTSLIAIASKESTTLSYLPEVWKKESEIISKTKSGDILTLHVSDSRSLHSPNQVQERHKHRARLFGVIIMCFAVDNRLSYNMMIQYFQPFLKDLHIPMVACACKCDLYRPDYFVDPKTIAKKINLADVEKHQQAIQLSFPTFPKKLLNLLYQFCNWSNLTLIQKDEIEKLCTNLNIDYAYTSAKKKQTKSVFNQAASNIKQVKVHSRVKRVNSNISDSQGSKRSPELGAIKSKSFFRSISLSNSGRTSLSRSSRDSQNLKLSMDSRSISSSRERDSLHSTKKSPKDCFSSCVIL